MKRCILMMLLVLLLAGCGTVPEETIPSETVVQPETEQLHIWQLRDDYAAVYALGSNLLLQSESGLTLVNTVDSTVLASVGDLTLPEPGSSQIWAGDYGVFWYLEETRTVFLYDLMLVEIGRLQLEDTVIGPVQLNGDGTKLYYCTANDVKVLDMQASYSTSLRPTEQKWLGITGVFVNDSLLRCNVLQEDGTVQTLVISAQTGQVIDQGSAFEGLTGIGSLYVGCKDGQWICGQGGGRTKLLLVDHDLVLPLTENRVLGVTNDLYSVHLDVYDVQSGIRTAAYELKGVTQITDLTWHNGKVCFLSGRKLYCWDPSFNDPQDDMVYIEVRYTAEEPDTAGLAVCRETADRLEEEYGIEILFYKDVLNAVPDNCSFEMDHVPEVFAAALERLENAFSQFPTGFFETVAQWTRSGKLHILLTAQILVEDDTYCQCLPGLQYLQDTDIYIALEMGEELERSFYHNLAHAIDIVVLSNSTKFYEWDKLNPGKFSYDYNYTEYSEREDSAYLESGKEYFVNTYAMSFPVEDRATIFEYAVTHGNDSVFASKFMQKKLKRICDGLSEVFAPEDGDYIWEQYLG